MTDRTTTFSLAVVEGIYLADLVDQFTRVLADSDATDPGIQRLTPDVYPDDAKASADFSSMTHDDLIEQRRTDAALVRAELDPLLSTASEALIDEEGSEQRELRIPVDDLEAWLRTLAALRLVIATRLDITTEDVAPAGDDLRLNVYDWLGYRLEQLVLLADAEDDEPA